MMIRGMIVALALVLCAVTARSEETETLLWRSQVSAIRLTGNARVDFVGLGEFVFDPGSLPQDAATDATRRKSPWIAAGLSIAVPGAGEFYSESFWKAAAFFAVDVAVWALAYSYDKRGDRQTDLFQDFANQHWSVVEYAQYAFDNLAPPGGDYAGLFRPATEGRPPWERVDWNVLNRMERDISATAKGQYYSHTLPRYNEQQYYELIGKYPQFNQGWDDAPPTFTYGDPVTPRFLFYSKERGKANDYYTTASTYVTVAIVNHVLSAIDAAWTASSYNGSVHAKLELQSIPSPYGVTNVPVLKISHSF